MSIDFDDSSVPVKPHHLVWCCLFGMSPVNYFGSDSGMTTLLDKTYPIVANSRAKPQKPRQWNSMLIHQGWFTALYTQHLLDSHSFEFEICIFSREAIPSHYSPSEKTRPESWPGDYMGKATPVWRLSSSHRCHQM